MVCFPNSLSRSRPCSHAAPLHERDPQALSMTFLANPSLHRIGHRGSIFRLAFPIATWSESGRDAGEDRDPTGGPSRVGIVALAVRFLTAKYPLTRNYRGASSKPLSTREASTRSRGSRLTATCTSNPSDPEVGRGPTKDLATGRARLHACRAPGMSRFPFT